MRNYDQLSISVDSPNCSTNKAQLPYNDLFKIQHQRIQCIHDRKASNMTQPKEKEHENFKYRYELTARAPQSEQKPRFYHKIKKNRSTTKKKCNFNSKERIPFDIMTGGKNLGVPEKSTLHKNNIKVENSIKGRIKKSHKKRKIRNNHIQERLNLNQSPYDLDSVKKGKEPHSLSSKRLGQDEAPKIFIERLGTEKKDLRKALDKCIIS
jgi:hypothetical protein